MGASITITPDRADFLTPITPVQPTTLSGIAANLQVQGIGTVTYQFPLPNGTTTSVTLKNVLYVPGCAVRLLCPRHLAESTIIEGDGFLSLQHGGILTCNGIELPVSYDRNTGLPIIYTIGQPALMSSSTLQNPCAANAISNPAPVTPYPSVTQIKPNLSKSQHLKLLMHERCNHRNMADVSQWIRQGLLPVHPSVANCPDPICLACQHGKARRKAHNKSTGGITGASHAPGDGVSADQLEAGCPGRIPTSKGLPTTKRYRYCNLWIDHSTRFVFPTFNETKHATELVASKTHFEAFAAKFHVKIKRIRADNGVYSAGLFQQSCELLGQDLSFCAVGGHWQNGVAERHIGLLTQTARTLLLHATSKWPQVLTEEFWPFAFKHACNFHNASIHSETHQTPYFAFTGERPPWRMSDFRVFGCPVFVLDKRLQDGDSLAKWKARSWTGVYIGHSTQHAGNVPLVYNPITTHVSPQYHVTFDDSFSTVQENGPILPEQEYERLYSSDEWLFKNSFSFDTDQHLFDSFWMRPPTSCSSSVPIRTTNKSRVPRPTSPSFTREATISASHENPTCNPAVNLIDGDQTAHNLPGDHAACTTGDHAAYPVAGDHAAHTAGDQAAHRTDPNRAERPIGDQAEQPTGDHAGCPSACHSSGIMESPVPEHNLPNIPEKPYVNLIPLPCSPAVTNYCHAHGLAATVFTAQSTNPVSTQPTPIHSRTRPTTSFPTAALPTWLHLFPRMLTTSTIS